ncbi:D-alanyl-D-alanine carboxypeptidase/D-alanyl-D-alanine-endopeptidase [Blastopirellula sp. JC732]|uniref:D-alanyl-D-alanine carboxypeptidase/D-alanyl-D-alanine-endopeptidase n=1 Tax=Blastopirellula sediminis TaxID=2894196 RepID=A0A9X1MTG5_9BACT|nr:D-alanyl-D-alanine carboxypeptidase/D-alanyl-D-alanine-endopeptidase [Blastopirellula sediminis]MCC9604524.1 D-alanyl-D-alanine carboxypeptidase/D-alanyl-D-alanine-endopeptidase [Blastopirellula sediminis]MCC9632177.1 D-alanyl-D-alanine carboxypeptidase/D-alanyl-D-alanine-endopeptidase [Blastopirellula sediminis]
MFRFPRTILTILPVILLSLTSVAQSQVLLSPEVDKILQKPLYKNATWGILVIDLQTGDTVFSKNADRQMLIGSIRKMFSVGLALDQLGEDYRFVTPIYRQGEVKDGVLNGDLVVVASGDLSMGGRERADGTIAYTKFDHNEANSLGNAILTKTDPLAGYRNLAQQIAAAGIKRVDGDVIIDDRLFQTFNFRHEFDLRPIFINDDVVDMMLQPGATAGTPADVAWRPHSAALTLAPQLKTTGPGSELELDYDDLPNCIGKAGCQVPLTGHLPIDLKPVLTGEWPLVRNVRITQPQNYARTVLIEELAKAGVAVAANKTAPNDAAKLPAVGSYQADHQVAKLTSAKYAQFAQWILKVSYNIGADTSLMLYGVQNGVDTLEKSLAAEAKALKSRFDVSPSEFHFVDGSGGGDTAATSQAIAKMLTARTKLDNFATFKQALPILGVNGSLATVTRFEENDALQGAKANVYAKTGTYITGDEQGRMIVRAQGTAGYIDAASGRKYAFVLVVNNIGVISGIDDVIQVMQDEGEIAAWWWRQN